MGGKHKQGNRTKKNVRPSSSSHSAELLGNSIPTFFGFSNVKDGASAFPTEDVNYAVDANFQIVLKKMQKKDSTTKLKALQEFAELCRNSEEDAVKAVLPFWPRLYCLLCTDVEHRVREAAHQSHRAIISKIKRSIAPYLKQIAGPWFTSQYDTYPPAANAATLAFNEAFSPSKLSEAIVFCQEEILNYIYENLVKHTPQTLSNPKTSSADEMDAKYERVVIASLQGFSLFLQRLSVEQIQKAEENIKKLISSGKFWKYAKHDSALIRNSFFGALIALCQNAKYMLAGESSHMGAAIFNNLDESDAMVLPTVWDAALSTFLAVEDCWSHINLEKQVFPKLCVILRDGGRGNAVKIFPNILPLLSKMSPDMIRNKNVFYNNLFDNMRLGLATPTVNQSISEGRVVATTFIECLKYIIMNNSSDVEFCKSLISNQLIRALETQLLSENAFRRGVTISILCQTSQLAQYWHRNQKTGQSEYELFLRYFWELASVSFAKQIEGQVSETVKCNVLSNQVQFLCILQNPNKDTVRAKGRVKFAEENQPEVEKGECAKTDSTPPEFKEELLECLVKKVALMYLKNSLEEQTPIYLTFLNQIVNAFDSKRIFEELASAQNESKLFSLFTPLFSNWLNNQAMRVSEIVDLSFNLMQFVSNDEKTFILNVFGESCFNDSLLYDVCRALLTYSKDDCVRKWIQSEQFANSIVDLTKKFVEGDGDDSMSRNVIVMFLKATSENGELLIGADTASRIIDLVSKEIRQSGQNEHVNELGQDLILQNKVTDVCCRSSFEELVASVFQLSCCRQNTDKLVESCESGLRIIVSAALSTNSGLGFTRKLAEVIREIIFERDVEFCLDDIICKINKYTELIIRTDFSEACASNSDIKDALLIVKMLIEDPPEVTVWREKIQSCCRFCYQGKGGWDLRYVDIEARDVTQADTKLDDYLQKLSEISDELDESFIEVNTWNLSRVFEENLPLLKKFRRLYVQYRKLESSSVPNNEITADVLEKFARWNLFVGTVLNWAAAAHPRCYKTAVLKNELNPYCLTDEELVAFVERNPDSDVIPIKITLNDKKELEEELHVVEDVFHEEDYEEKNNLSPLCNHIFDFVFSVGILDAFAAYQASTKYYSILKEPLKGLKDIAKDIFRNANVFENLFCYYACRHFTTTESDWRMILPSLKQMFSRNFSGEKEDVDQKNALNFIEKNISVENSSDSTVMRLIYMIDRFAHHMKEPHLDSIFIYVDSLLETFVKKIEFSESDMLSLSVSSRLCLDVMLLFDKNESKPEEEKLPADSCLAWNEVVVPELWKKLMSIWWKLAKEWHNKKEMRPEYLTTLENVSEFVVNGVRFRTCADPADSVQLAKDCGRYIASPHIVFQITSFQLLSSFVPDLVKLDAEIFRSNVSQISQENKEGPPLFEKLSGCEWTCKALEQEINQNQGIVETLLSDFVVGDCCTVEPFTDSYSYAHSYLLLWRFLLEMCGEAHSSLRFQYAFWLKDSGFSNVFLESVFKLMPQSVLHGSEAKENCQKYFEQSSLNFRSPVTSESIEQNACFVYKMFLERLPNVIREWWNHAENNTATLVDKITTLYVSPTLIAKELKNVQQERECKLDKMEIKTNSTIRGVVATYTIDDVKMDLMMTLPSNHPLGTIKIDSSKAAAISSHWKNWLFHITKYLIHQNGTIWDTLILWKNNLDKKFEGVEGCYICFFILQSPGLEIPKLSCRTCKKKYHHECMYKWVQTSNNSTCPNCRNLF